ncbi:putative uncharacterized protein DDB_G0285119 [Hydra vulgaris]|uniref:putative uncharacterized protein DDB_G0285119 n=1 Tax=Hydra vulgaris TaxID=6087 RepID=UPI001F5FCC75|nr:putative uncharacterized protein DDB_G0285119 [Hydra vulgaris]XP_012553616.2 putative uncharacterized protein DDB_G0285119 [Hydra vulgaris]
MDLYDIPENFETGVCGPMMKGTPRMIEAQRTRSKSAPVHTQQKYSNNSNGNALPNGNSFYLDNEKFSENKTETFLVRSKTISDEFYIQQSNFNRNDPRRATMPVKTKFQNNLNDDYSKLVIDSKQSNMRERSLLQNGFKNEGKMSSPNNAVNKTTSSLHRSKSLKIQKSSYNVPVVQPTKSSELRLSKTRLESLNSPHTKTLHDKLSDSECSYTTNESDSCFVFNANKCNVATNSKYPTNSYSKLNGNNGNPKYNCSIQNDRNYKNNNIRKTDSYSKTQIKKSNTRFEAEGEPHGIDSSSLCSESRLCCSPITNMDNFSSRLNEVCNLITEKYPGEFLIIERLVEMQSAYEECNNSVNETIAQLRQRIVELEERQNSGIAALAIPLMYATSTFQSQIQNIINRKNLTTDFSVQVCNGQTQNSPLDEISNEANAVAAHIASLCLNSDIS